MPAYDAVLFLPPAPLARVTLRNAQSGQTVSDIPLLIDSGADVTLIPESAIKQIGITIESTETYELQSFDQRISTAHPVHLEMLFLRRTFRGKFLVIGQEWGILGRDVLNRVVILLDGPGLSWREVS